MDESVVIRVHSTSMNTANAVCKTCFGCSARRGTKIQIIAKSCNGNLVSGSEVNLPVRAFTKKVQQLSLAVAQ